MGGSLLLAGCGGGGDPVALADSYFRNFAGGRYEAQYMQLLPEARKMERKETFVDYQQRRALRRKFLTHEMVGTRPKEIKSPWRALFKVSWETPAGGKETSWKGLTLVKKGGRWWVADTPSVRENAQNAYMAGEFSRATMILEEALKLNPTDAESLDLLGYVFRDNSALRNNLDMAIEVHREAVRLEPRNPDWHHSLGNDYRLLGWFSGAVEELNKAIDIDPRPHYYVWLGVAYASATKLDAARAAWREALKLDPDSAQAHAFLEKIR